MDESPDAASQNELPLPLLIYDGDCGFCQAWVGYWRILTGEAVRYAPSQEVAGDYPNIPAEAFEQSVQYVDEGGGVTGGAKAVFLSLAHVPSHGVGLWLYEKLPGFALLTEAAYHVVARHRGLAALATRLLVGRSPTPPAYQWVRWLYLRLLATVYLFAFASFMTQMPGLIGVNGIAPAQAYFQAVHTQLGQRALEYAPSIFLLTTPTNAALKVVAAVGLLLALLAMAGLVQRYSFAGLVVLYLSFIVAGQQFMSFQWDALLIEAGMLAVLLAPPTLLPHRPLDEPPVSPTAIWLHRWLIFRLMLLSGIVKLASGDPTWHNLTALTYHYETQPIPSPLAWYAYHLPPAFHHFSALMVFVIELGVPFLIFTPRRIRHLGAGVLIGFQVLLLVSGNYAFFNYLVIALCLTLFDDRALRPLVEWAWPSLRRETLPYRLPPEVERWVLAFMAAWIVLAGLITMVDTLGFYRRVPTVAREIVSPLETFDVVNYYGLFAVMTTTRPEIVIEGSNDGTNWLAYDLPYKPGDPAQAPRYVAPLQPRLDWQLWFAALGNAANNRWTLNLAYRLLQGQPDVLALFANNPFPDAPPRYIRMQLYDYHFTDPATHRAEGVWWERNLLGEYLPPLSLDDFQQGAPGQAAVDGPYR